MNKPFKTLWTPSGKIELYEATDPDYPGIYVDVNEQQIALIEHDASEECPVVRVWNGKDEDYIFARKLPAVKMEVKPVQEEETEQSAAVSFILDRLYELTQKEEEEDLTEHEVHLYIQMVEFLQENDIPIEFGIQL